MTGFLNKTVKNVALFLKPRALMLAVLTAALAAAVVMFAGDINTYIINYGGNSVTVHTLKEDIGTALNCAGISADNYVVDTAEKTGERETTVSLLKTFAVPVTSGDNTVTVTARETDTVADVLTCAGFTVDGYDMVEPSLKTLVNEETYIDYVNIDYVTGSYTQTIPYSVTTVYSSDLDAGKKVTTPGKDGLEQVNYTKRLVNGEVVETKINEKVTLLAAQSAVQTVGTRRAAVKTSSSISTISELTPDSPISFDSNGNPVNYKKHITVQATAYTYTGHNCSTGVAPRPGYIAVNPKYIPYGTKMYIKSSDGRYVYGYAIAADTGGFIYSHPTNVDLFFPTVVSMNTFGRRNVEIYILE